MSTESEPKPRADIGEIKESDRVTKNDKQAKKEEKDLFKVNAKQRVDTKKTHVHRVFLILIWVGLALVVITLLTRISHLLMPVPWHWLEKAQIEQIDQFLFSGLIGGFLGRYVHNAINTHQDDP